MINFSPTKKPTLSLAPHKIRGRDVIALNAINVEIRVEREIAQRLAANDAMAVANGAAHRARMKRIRDDNRQQGDALLTQWADWIAWDSQGLGYPPANMLARYMKSPPAKPRSDFDEDGKLKDPERTLMTLVEIQAHAQGMYMQIDNVISDPGFPASFRNVLKLVYADRMRQDRAASDLGMTQPELSLCIGMAREHVCIQYHAMKPRWS